MRLSIKEGQQDLYQLVRQNDDDGKDMIREIKACRVIHYL